MSNEQPLSHESGALHWYGGLINLYPGAFRERYAAEMLQIFEESWSRVSQRGATARWRYWLHVLFDLVRTLPSEWLAAMPTEIKFGLMCIGGVAALFAIDYEVMNIAYGLFFLAFTIACFAISVRPLRLRSPSLLLLAGALGSAGFWITARWATFGHNPDGSTWVMLIFSVLLAGVLAAIIISFHFGWKAAARQKRQRSEHVVSKALAGNLLAMLVAISIKIYGSPDRSYGRFSWAMLICQFCPQLVRRLWEIWQTPDAISQPDSETRRA
jgi:hypothetical protein